MRFILMICFIFLSYDAFYLYEMFYLMMRFILRCTLFNEMFYLMKCFVFLSYDAFYLMICFNDMFYLNSFKALFIQSFIPTPLPIISKPLLSISFKF